MIVQAVTLHFLVGGCGFKFLICSSEGIFKLKYKDVAIASSSHKNSSSQYKEVISSLWALMVITIHGSLLPQMLRASLSLFWSAFLLLCTFLPLCDLGMLICLKKAEKRPKIDQNPLLPHK